MNTYLSVRHQLKLIALVLDIRHKPSDDDLIMHKWLTTSQVPYFVIASKSDKLNRSQLITNLSALPGFLNANNDISIIPFSALNRQGRDDIWNVISSYINT